jgi:hypothetical protein
MPPPAQKTAAAPAECRDDARGAARRSSTRTAERRCVACLLFARSSHDLDLVGAARATAARTAWATARHVGASPTTSTHRGYSSTPGAATPKRWLLRSSRSRAANSWHADACGRTRQCGIGRAERPFREGPPSRAWASPGARPREAGVCSRARIRRQLHPARLVDRPTDASARRCPRDDSCWANPTAAVAGVVVAGHGGLLRLGAGWASASGPGLMVVVRCGSQRQGRRQCRSPI